MVSFFGTDTSPSSGGLLAGDHAEERGLARAVRADQADLLAGIELEGGVDEEDLLPYCLLMRENEIISVYGTPDWGDGVEETERTDSTRRHGAHGDARRTGRAARSRGRYRECTGDREHH